MTPPQGTPLMDVQEFVRDGYLHEVNRRFLHPLGLALEITTGTCPRCADADEPEVPGIVCATCGGTRVVAYSISGVWDCRDDPEGIRFAIETLSREAAENIDLIWARRTTERVKRLGYMVQPPDPQALTAAALLDS